MKGTCEETKLFAFLLTSCSERQCQTQFIILSQCCCPSMPFEASLGLEIHDAKTFFDMLLGVADVPRRGKMAGKFIGLSRI